MSSGRKVAIGVGAVVAVIVAALAFLLWPRTATEVTEDQAVEDFRDRSTTTSKSPDDTPERTTPRPGVYTYSAEGTEDVKLGPLPTETRTLPSTLTAVAVDAGDGCFDWTVNLFTQHTEDTRFCTDPVLTFQSHAKHQTIGAISATATITCDPKALLTPEAKEGTPSSTELNCTLELAGGPKAVKATLAGTATWDGHTEKIDVGGTDVDTRPIKMNFPVTGDITGTWDETVWWSGEHLPVRIERSFHLAGPATFNEDLKLQLTSLEPSS